jgi:homoserine O-acetyltransferase
MLQWIDPGVLDAKYGRDRLLGMPTQYGFEPEFAVEHMIDHVGEGADSRLDANSFLYLTKAIDYFDLAAGHETLRAALVPAGGDYLLVSYERDHRYPPAETERLAAALRDCGRCVKHAILSSPFSHGAYQFDLEGLTPLVKEHLASPTVRSVRDARLTEPVEHDFAHSEAMSPSLEKS